MTEEILMNEDYEKWFVNLFEVGLDKEELEMMDDFTSVKPFAWVNKNHTTLLFALEEYGFCASAGYASDDTVYFDYTNDFYKFLSRIHGENMYSVYSEAADILNTHLLQLDFEDMANYMDLCIDNLGDIVAGTVYQSKIYKARIKRPDVIIYYDPLLFKRSDDGSATPNRVMIAYLNNLGEDKVLELLKRKLVSTFHLDNLTKYIDNDC